MLTALCQDCDSKSNTARRWLILSPPSGASIAGCTYLASSVKNTAQPLTELNVVPNFSVPTSNTSGRHMNAGASVRILVETGGDLNPSFDKSLYVVYKLD